MHVILLQKVRRLGDIGDLVEVKPGFARNYLLPFKFALRAVGENLKLFEERKGQLEAENLERRKAAELNAEKLSKVAISIARQASKDGRLYGSVTASNIVAGIDSVLKIKLSSAAISISDKFRELGVYEVDIMLHPDVQSKLQVHIVRDDGKDLVRITDRLEKTDSNTAASENVAAEASK